MHHCIVNRAPALDVPLYSKLGPFCARTRFFSCFLRVEAAQTFLPNLQPMLDSPGRMTNGWPWKGTTEGTDESGSSSWSSSPVPLDFSEDFLLVDTKRTTKSLAGRPTGRCRAQRDMKTKLYWQILLTRSLMELPLGCSLLCKFQRARLLLSNSNYIAMKYGHFYHPLMQILHILINFPAWARWSFVSCGTTRLFGGLPAGRLKVHHKIFHW